jgi:hypothetical protein
MGFICEKLLACETKPDKKKVPQQLKQRRDKPIRALPNTDANSAFLVRID